MTGRVRGFLGLGFTLTVGSMTLLFTPKGAQINRVAVQRGNSRLATGNSGLVSRHFPLVNAAEANSVAHARMARSYAKLPLSFETNKGQAGDQVKFLSRGNDYRLFLSSTEAILEMRKPSRISRLKDGAVGPRNSNYKAHGSPPRDRQSKHGTALLRMKLAGANLRPEVRGLEELPGKSNYFIGNDRTKWHTGIPTYRKVVVRDVYPGIDLVYYGNQYRLEYDFLVSAGADPNAIKLSFEGADKMRIDKQGDLVLESGGAHIRFKKPSVYQEVDGVRRALSGGYELNAEHQAGFWMVSYDRTRPLVIDPVLAYSTYLSGTKDDSGNAIAVDASGNAYVTGSTASTDFPTQSPFQPSLGGLSDAFVAKLNSTGTALVYSTYIGGDGDDGGTGIVVDASGNTYVVGYTYSANFPTANPFQAALAGASDAFIAKLGPTGSALLYSTYLGGRGDDSGSGIGLDSSGNAYITGGTRSSDFPVTSGAFQTSYGGGTCGSAPNNTFPCGDAFVAKLDTTGTALIYSTYLGGNNDDSGTGIAVDATGNAHVTGYTASTNFPSTPGAFQTTHAGGTCGSPPSPCTDVFVTEMNSVGSSLLYSTFLGGNDQDLGYAIALDVQGNAYVTGTTYSTNFPTRSPLQSVNAGNGDAFVTKLNATGSVLAYSTYLGGSDSDSGDAIAVDGQGNAYVTGSTGSTNFSTVSPLQAAYGGNGDAFLTKLNASGTALVYSTYLGGSGAEYGAGVAVDESGNTYLTGSTIAGASSGSADFPVTLGSFMIASVGGGCGSVYYGTYESAPCSDAFVVKISTLDAAAVALGPARLTFASQSVGTASSPQVVRVTDSGSAALSITSIAASGDFTQTNNCGSSLTAGASCTISVIFTPAATGPRTGELTITDDAAGSPHQVSLSGNLKSDFSVSSPSAGATITAGQSATYAIDLTPTNGFNQTVALSCAGAPFNATCSISPSSLTLNGTNASTATMIVTTIARSAVPPAGRYPTTSPDLNPPTAPLWLLLLLSLAMSVSLLWRDPSPCRTATLPKRAWLGMGFVVFIAFLAVGCGGRNVPLSGPAPASGTPAGTYTLMVTATSGTLAHNTTVTLTVK
jgi:hypothetical protein